MESLEIKEIIGVIAVILGVIGYIPYIRDVLRGKTRPHVYSWCVWSLITYTIFALQITDNAGPGAWVTLVVGLLGSLIFVLGMRQGDKDITKSDTLLFIAALISLCLWLVAEQPEIAMVLLIITALFGFIPTVRKSWNRPHTETLSTYIINVVRHALSFFALANYSLLTWLFPVFWTAVNLAFAIYLIIRRRYSN